MGNPCSPVTGMKPLSQSFPGKATRLAVQLGVPEDDPAAGEVLCIWPPAGLATAHLGEEPRWGKGGREGTSIGKERGKGIKGTACVRTGRCHYT